MAPVETTAVIAPEPVAALCERVRAAAQAAGEEALRARRDRADAVVAEARRRAPEDAQARHRLAEGRLRKQAAREMQDARLAARALEANARWAELDAVLDEAVREAVLIRRRDPQRYAAALARFLRAARDQLAAPRLRVEADADDFPYLRGADCDLIQAVVAPGILVTTPDGNAVCDQTIAARRRRLDAELRLAAAEALFPDEASPS
jgi:vacuolar-type H+-ATPase subunit E/Vma4